MKNGFYEEGKQAFLNGKRVEDNPHVYSPEPDSGFMQWRNGYLDTQMNSRNQEDGFGFFNFSFAM